MPVVPLDENLIGKSSKPSKSSGFRKDQVVPGNKTQVADIQTRIVSLEAQIRVMKAAGVDTSELQSELNMLNGAADVIGVSIPQPKLESLVRTEIKEAELQVSKASRIEYARRFYNDFAFFCTHLTILYRAGMNPDFPNGGSGPFILSEAQRLVIDNIIHDLYSGDKKVRAVVLKSRQLGFTTVMLAFELWLCVKRDNFHVMFMIDKDEHFGVKREVLCQWIDDLKRNYPWIDTPYITTKAAKRVTLSNKSRIFFESAMAPNPGTSEMIHFIHFSEMPKWQKGKARLVKDSMLPSLPESEGTIHINESTAKGLEEFYRDYNRAKDGKSSYKAYFAPWYLSNEYRAKVPDNFKFSLQEDHGDYIGENWICEEDYARQYRLDRTQVMWRRNKINNIGLSAFNQEYPTTADHAFRISGGVNFFSKSMIESVGKAPVFIGDIIDPKHDDIIPTLWSEYNPVLQPAKIGPLSIWEHPVPGQTYCMGADTCEGKAVVDDEGDDDPDYFVLTVKNESGKTVARYRDRVKPENCWYQIVLLAIYYNNAYVNGERNNSGETCLSYFNKTGYPNNYIRLQPSKRPIVDRMWSVTGKVTRQDMLNKLRSLYTRNPSAIVDDELIKEMGVFVYNANTGKPQAASGYHDDIIMSEAIAEMCRLWYFGEEYKAPEEPIDMSLLQEPEEKTTFTLEDTNYEEVIGEEAW